MGPCGSGRTFALALAFGNLPTGHTSQQILIGDGSKHLISLKDVPFGVRKIKVNI